MRGTITNTGSLELGIAGDVESTWAIQVAGFPGLTSVTPEVSVNGSTWAPASVEDADAPGTPVTSITANGVYYMHLPGNVKARLTGVGAGSVTIDAVASLR